MLVGHSLDENDLAMNALQMQGRLMSDYTTPAFKSNTPGVSMYDEAAIEAAVEIAMLVSICRDRKAADALVKAILTDNLAMLNTAAVAILTAAKRGSEQEELGR